MLVTLCLVLAPIIRCAQLTKDDIDFREKAYVDKSGAHLPYYLFLFLATTATANARCCFGSMAAMAAAATT